MSDAHVIFVGQSNMLGWMNTGPAPYTPTWRVQIWTDTNANGQWDVGDNFNMMVPGVNTGLKNHQSWGPEVEFANQWLANNPSGILWIGKVVDGGIALAQNASLDWSPLSTGELYDRAEYVALSMQYNLGITSIDAVFWLQGETDATNQTWAGDYEQNFRDLLAAIEQDFTLDTSIPEIGWARIHDSSALAYNFDVRVAQWLIDSETVDKVESFRTVDLTRQADDIHFDTASLVTIGERFYNLWDGWSL